MAGIVLVIAGVAAGLLTAVLTVPYAAQVLSVVSFAYLGFIAYRITTAPPVGEAGAAAAAPGFLSGLVLNLTNLKAYAAFAALFSGFELMPQAPVASTLDSTFDSTFDSGSVAGVKTSAAPMRSNSKGSRSRSSWVEANSPVLIST